MDIIKHHLQQLYRGYTKQINKDHALRNKVAKELSKKFAPFKPGDKVMYIPKWVMKNSIHYQWKRCGTIVRCEYDIDEQGNWDI